MFLLIKIFQVYLIVIIFEIFEFLSRRYLFYSVNFLSMTFCGVVRILFYSFWQGWDEERCSYNFDY